MMKLDKARLIVACAAGAIAGWVLPSSAIEYLAHWDFSSDALGEAEELNNYPLVNHGVTIADGSAVFDGSTSPVKHFVSTCCGVSKTGILRASKMGKFKVRPYSGFQ